MSNKREDLHQRGVETAEKKPHDRTKGGEHPMNKVVSVLAEGLMEEEDGTNQEFFADNEPIPKAKLIEMGKTYADLIPEGDRTVSDVEEAGGIFYFYKGATKQDNNGYATADVVSSADYLGNWPNIFPQKLYRNERDAEGDLQFIEAAKKFAADPTITANEKSGIADKLLTHSSVANALKSIVHGVGRRTVTESFLLAAERIQADPEAKATKIIQDLREERHLNESGRKADLERQLVLRTFLEEVYPELKNLQQYEESQLLNNFPERGEYDTWSGEQVLTYIQSLPVEVTSQPHFADELQQFQIKLSNFQSGSSTRSPRPGTIMTPLRRAIENSMKEKFVERIAKVK